MQNTATPRRAKCQQSTSAVRIGGERFGRWEHVARSLQGQLFASLVRANSQVTRGRPLSARGHRRFSCTLSAISTRRRSASEREGVGLRLSPNLNFDFERRSQPHRDCLGEIAPGRPPHFFVYTFFLAFATDLCVHKMQADGKAPTSTDPTQAKELSHGPG